MEKVKTTHKSRMEDRRSRMEDGRSKIAILYLQFSILEKVLLARTIHASNKNHDTVSIKG